MTNRALAKKKMTEKKRYEGFSCWEDLAKALEEKAEKAPKAERAALYLRAGTIYGDVLLRKGEAMTRFQLAVKQDPGCREAVRHAREIYEQMGKLTMVGKLIDIELKVVQDRQSRVELRMLKAYNALYSGKLAAAAEQVQEALSLDPENAEAVLLGGDLAVKEDFYSRAVSIEQDVQKLKPGEKGKAAFLYVRAGILYRREGETQNALRCFEQACRLAPEDPRALLFFEETAVEAGDTAAVFQLYESLASAAGSDEAKVAAYQHVASRLMLRFENLEKASGYLSKALDLRPDLDGALLIASQVWSESEGGPLKIALYAEKAARAAGEADARAFFLAKAVETYRSDLGDEAGAARLEKDLSAAAGPAAAAPAAPGPADEPMSVDVEVVPEDESAGSSDSQEDAEMKDTDERDGSSSEGSAGAESPWVDPTDEVEALLGKARGVADAQKALASWREVLGKAPRTEEAFAGLMRSCGETGKWNYAVEAHKKAIAEIPETSVQARVEIMLSMGRLYRDKMNQETSSISVFQQVLKTDPTNDEATGILLEIYQKMNRWPDYVKLLALKAENASSVEDKVAGFLDVAQIYLERFNNQGEAMKCYERVMETDPQNETASAYLLQMYEKRRDWEKYVMLSLSRIEKDPAGHFTELVELATMADERVRKPAVSIDLWSKVIAIDENHPDAINALSGLYERNRDWDKLAVILRRQADMEADATKKKASLLKLGLLFTDKVQNDEEAVRTWKELLALDPQERRAIDQLKKRYIAMRAWDEIEAFFEETGGKWDELVRLMERELEAEGLEDQVKIGILYRIAKLLRDRIGKPDKCAAALEQVLSIRADEAEAAEMLIPIYEQGNSWEKLAHVLEIKLGHIEDDSEKHDMMVQIASIFRDNLSDHGSAFDWYVKALEEVPGRLDEIVDPLEQAAGASDRWKDLVVVYERILKPAKGDDARRIKVLMAGVLHAHLGEPEKALKLYNGILEDDPNDQEALARVESIYSELGKFDELQAVLEKRLDLTSDPDEKLAIRRKVAAIYDEALGDRKKAIEAYTQILEDSGDDVETLAAMGNLLEAESRWKELLDVVERQMVLLPSGSDEYLEKQFRYGKICEEKLSNASKAFEAYREILAIKPSHEAALAALKAFIDDEKHKAEAARILEPVLEQIESWEDLSRCLLILADVADDPASQVDYLRRVSEIYIDKMSSPEQGFVTNGRALKLDTANPEIMADLEQIAEVLDAWGDLDDLLVGIASQAKLEDETKKLIWLKIAEIRHARMSDKAPAAIEAYRKVIAIEPGNLHALNALEALYQEAGSWQELQEIFKQKIEVVVDEGEKLQIWFRLAMLQNEMLDAPDEAITCYREVLNLSPGNAEALGHLEKLYERQLRWTDLADNLQAQLDMVSDPSGTVALKLRLAALREEKMKENESAIEIYREVLDAEPTNQQAIAALERLVAIPTHEMAIAEILEPIYKERQDWVHIVQVDEIFIRHSDSPDRKVELLGQIAEMYELAGDDPRKAFESFSRALAEDPVNETTQANIDRLGRVLDATAEVIKVYESATAGVEDAELEIGLHTKIAGLYEIEVGDLEGAIRHYRAILDLDATNLHAIEALERIYSASERWPDLATTLKQKAAVVGDPAQKKELYLNAGRIYEEMLESIPQAVESYATILEFEPEDQTALDKLALLYQHTERWAELLDVLKRKADIVLDIDEKKKITFESGDVYLEKLSDIDHAVDCFIRVTELDPDDVAALAKLDEIYVRTGRWTDLLPIVQREADLAYEPEQNLDLRHRIGKLHEEHLEDVPHAVEVYREILAVMPDHARTVEALEGLIASGKEAASAAIVLEPIHDANADWEKLVRVLEVQLAAQEDAWERVKLLHRIATYYEDDRFLGNPAEAFRTYARAMHVEPRNEETLSALERIAENLRNWQDLAVEYDKAIEATEDPDVKIIIGLRAARVYEEDLNNVEAAIAHYNSVVGIDNRNAVAIHSLSRLYRVAQRWEDLLHILDLEMDIAATEEEALELKSVKAQLCYSELGRVDQSLETYKEILGVNPDHGHTIATLELLFDEGVERARIFEILRPLYESAGEWEKLCAKEETLANEAQAADEKIEHLVSAASIWETKLIDGDKAFEYYGRAFVVDPRAERPALELDRLADALGEWVKLSELLDQVLAAATDKEVKLHTGKKLAPILEERLMDPHRAMDVWVQLMALDAGDREVLEPLDRLYTAAMEWESLSVVLEHRIQVEEDETEKVELLTRYGRLLQVELARPDDAIKAYRRIVDELGVAHPPALEGLEAIYLDQGSWKLLFEVLEKQADNMMSESDQAAVWAKMANVAAMGLESPEKAIELWEKVLDVRGDDPEALEALAELYHGLSRWSDLVAVLERAIMAQTSDQERIRMYDKLGRIWSEKLERDKSALECWDNILAIEPGNVVALKEKSEIFERMGEWDDLIETLNQITDFGVATMEDKDLRAVYARQARVFEEKLERSFDAVEAWKKVLNIDPNDMEALRELRKLYAKDESWEDHVGVLSRLAPLVETDDERVALWLEAAGNWADKLLVPANAAEAYEEVLRIDPRHENAFTELERLYTEMENAKALSQVYLNRYEVTEAQPARTKLLLSIANLYEEKMLDEESAFFILQKAYLEDFRDSRATEEIERITAKIGKWEELIASVNGKLAELGNRQEASTLYLQVGRWYGERMGNLQYATACYGKVLQMDPNNIGALSAIADLYKNAGQWDNYVHYLKMQVEKAGNDEVKKEILAKLGRTYDEELARPEDAIDAFRQVLAIDSKHKEALESLEVLYRNKEAWKDLIKVLESKLDLVDPAEAEKRIEILMSLGEVHEIHTGDGIAAVKAYQQAVELDSQNMTALRGLERLYTAMEKWQDLIDVMEMEFSVSMIDKEKIDFLLRIAQMLEREFLKPADAVGKYEQVLTIDPSREEALSNLERIHRQEKKWEELVEVLGRHVMVADSDDRKIELLLAQGKLLIEEIEDPTRGIETYRHVLDLDETHPAALDVLAKLYEHSEMFGDALEILERLLRVTLEPTTKVQLLYRMGVILDQQLGKREEAVERFQEAVQIDPGHLESLGALRTIYIDTSEWGLAEQVLEVEQQNTTVPTQRSELLYARGRILRDYLQREDEAIACFQEAMKLDPENEEAAEPLVTHYLVNNLYAESEPLIDMLLKKWAKKPGDELLPYYLSLAHVCDALGNEEKALRAFKSAFELDAGNLEALKGMALILYKLKQWDKAFKYYQMILVQHLDSQKDDEKVDIYFHLGNIKLNVNEPRKALNMYEKALGIDGHHRPTLEALIALFDKQRDFEQVIHFKKTIAETLEGREKFDMLVDIGDTWKEKLQNSAKAIAGYNDALQIIPDDRTLLHKLMAEYSATKQWAKAVDVLKMIAEKEENEQRKSRYYHSIAVIYHQEVKDSDQAIEFFNKALDADPDNLKDFEAIEQIVTPNRDWKALERNYRKMLHRIAGRDKKSLEEALWHGLGEIYRTRMQNFEAAAEAFKMASALSPDNQLRHEILAELYTLIPEKWQEAVKEHQTLIRQNPNRVESYRALRRLYQDNRQYDKAWCLCSTLNFLKKADAEEQRFFEQYRQKGMARAQQTLDNENWIKNLFHKEEDPYVGKIFEVVTTVVRPRKLQPQKAYGLKKKDKKDPFTSTEAFSRIFGTIVRVLNLPMPELYVRYDQPFGLQYAITDPPASVVGQALLSGYTPQDLTFIIAKHLTYYRGEHYIRLLEPTTGGLKALLLASMKTSMPEFVIPPDIAGQIMPVVQVLQSSLLPVQLEQLRRVVRAFSESKASADIKKWASAVELTACRAGLLLSNDLEVAVRMVNAEPPGFSEVPPKEKVMQLILFSVSEEYFSLREVLGITIGT